MAEYLWTIVPFLALFGLIVLAETRHRRRSETAQAEVYNSLVRPVARVTANMYKKQFGRPCTNLEEAFPEIGKRK